ncbi:secretion protein HlyD family protein [Rhodopirellula maiorica SM1]|uniref:Secretion protein HlyD family protein n=1 Tax=Rhodopirellula maiorica SM1 TaxID=1265738 RepID=M5RJY1_9BACT|nr:HlyD family efflux transporter periplasmic adaptor subunit [Rhodopirellula maiorica]EMI19501.1 secretion protein HlyD family protein [Rhodopirellula maiorica SM1]
MMNRIHTLAASLTIMAVAIGATPLRAESDSLQIGDLIVVVIDEVQVPALETGSINTLSVHEGMTVKRGDVLATLDRRRAELQQRLAKIQLQIATAKADDPSIVALANKAYRRQQQLSKQQSVDVTIATQKASNDLSVLAATKAEAVAKNELARAVDARKRYIDSVSQSEIDGLSLAYERARLEKEQAQFEQQIDQLNVESEQQAEIVQKIAVDEAEIQLSQSAHQHKIEVLQQQRYQHQSELADLFLDQHTIVAPFDATVVEVMRRRGDWVRAGDPVVRLVGLRRLRAEGYVDATLRTRLLTIDSPTLFLHDSDGNVIERTGDIVFVSPEIDPVNQQVRLTVEFENLDDAVLPGMRMTMRLRTE